MDELDETFNILNLRDKKEEPKASLNEIASSLNQAIEFMNTMQSELTLLTLAHNEQEEFETRMVVEFIKNSCNIGPDFKITRPDFHILFNRSHPAKTFGKISPQKLKRIMEKLGYRAYDNNGRYYYGIVAK